ncbi:nck-associated protein 5 [Antechinus flavipes]|uniref:nck-associated protein 5 n=1 Tax=Antechinus flavipes TaxID=38775 RepID=UPI002236AD6C|nr:nck-associated protein 5 [Antechinus flavipes]
MEGKRQLEKRDFGKRLSLDSSLVEYMDSNKYIEHLLTQLEEQRRNLWREKLAVARLQREVARSRREGTMHEKLILELEEERHLRLQSEKQLREVTLESERSRVQMRGLQQQFSRMEETVRNLLQNQGPPEGKKEDTVNIMVYQEKLSEEEQKHKENLEDPHMVVDEDSRSESSSTDEGKEKTKLLLERLKALEAENSALALENENQREQYERCLDEVANQVVQALLTQKDLREECVKLKTRVFDLEQQNRTLSVLFQQRVKPASDLLLQKLHSRILDLSSGDLLSEVERNSSLMQSRTDVDIHECQLNAKSGVPVPKCPALNMTSSGRLCPRNSCSSSELSLSSTCSEYSSGSSYTWNDGKTLSKRSSINWDKRISIASSLPSGLASPADELPPTRIKESHILEGLRKLQKRKVLLEPPSVITKWGYKDCMNSNEGIYSPGIKCSSHKEHLHCKPTEAGNPCKEHTQAFTYDSDSHDDADDEASSLALLHEIPSKDHRLHCNKLTHSVSDSLFGWESNGKNFSENTSSTDFKEKPEKLTNFDSHCLSEGELCTNMQFQQEKGLPGLGHKDLNLQLSDTDDYETLDELHIESSDEKSPSDLLVTPGTQTFDMLLGHGKSQLVSSSKEENRAPIPSDSRPKTFSFIKQQRVIKKTSSEECITVIFDAEDGEPIEFSSHQTGVVTVTRDEISINQAPTGPNAEYTELLPQGITNLQLGMNTRDYSILKAPEDEKEKRTHKDIIGTGNTGVLVMPTESLSPERSILENTQRQKEAKSTHNITHRSNSVSLVSTGISHKQNLTKIPSRGKSLPQKSKDPDDPSIVSSPGSMALDKSPALPPVKLSRFQKAQSPGHHLHLQPDSHIPKQPKLLPHSSKNPVKSDWVKGSKSSLLLPRPFIEPTNYGEPPTKDKQCNLGPEEIAKSPSPPPPPGRSASLLIRPTYEHSPSLSSKPGTSIPSEMAKATLKSSPLKASPSAVISSNHAIPEVQGKKSIMALKKPDFSHPSSSEEKIVQSKCASQLSSGTFAMVGPGPPKVSPKRGSTKVSNHQASGNNQGLFDTGLQTTKNIPLDYGPIEMPSSKSSSPGRRGQYSDCLPKTPKSHPISGNEAVSSQVNIPSSSSPSKSHDITNNIQGSHDKGLKTRLPVGLKVLVKSPQLLRKSSTVPGKQEKESINAASKSCAVASKSKPEESIDLTRITAKSDELNVSMVDLDMKSSFASGLATESILPQSSESCHTEADRGDSLENRFMKRSTSSSKPHLKPALGMNGAKARSQSFSIHSGEKPSTTASEGLGKVRTQIITNTTDRGNSLTRQNSATDGFTNKTASGSTTENLSISGKSLEDSYSRQGSHGSTNNSSSQHGSPSKLPFRVSPKTEEIHSASRVETHRSPPQGDCPTLVMPEEPGNGPYRCLPSPSSPSHLLDQASSLQSPRRIQCLGQVEANSACKQEIPDKAADTFGIGDLSQDAPVPPTIEEKVMLCIQENVEKGQIQTKSPTMEAKQKTGPSIASWFGFRRSKLPALSGRKMDISKNKVEKKDAKSLGFGNKQQKLEKKKDKRKPELQCETENEFNRKTEMGNIPDNVLKSKRNMRSPQDIHVQMKSEQKNRLSPATCSTKDTFMKELLNRVDKKAAQQTESGSNNVSCRSVSKGKSQGSTLPSNSISTQGNHKKNSKTKAEMETPNETLIKEVTGSLQEDEEDTIMESGEHSPFQNHIIESSCQMRTLDSGIGTFPLPDSGNRSTGRHACKPDTSMESESFLSLQETLPSTPPIKAKTLEREVPSAANSQGSLESIIVHSTSDPVMTAKGIRPFQSRLPKPASSGINSLQRQNETESNPQTSFEYTEETMENEANLPDWNSDKTKTQQQKLKQVEETKEDSENRLSKISLESLNKLNSNSVILLEKEKNCLNKVERQREEKGKNEDASLKSSNRPGVDNLESLSDSLYDSFSSCASQGSNDV